MALGEVSGNAEVQQSASMYIFVLRSGLTVGKGEGI